MPANHPYDPRYNAKIYVPKLTEEERRARATPLESLRRPRTRPADAAAASAPPQVATPEIATQEIATPEPSAAELPNVEAAPPEVPTPEPVVQDASAPDYVPAAWEVVFAQFPELYPNHAEWVVAAAAPDDEYATRSPTLPGRRFRAARNAGPASPLRQGPHMERAVVGCTDSSPPRARRRQAAKEVERNRFARLA